MPIYASKDSAIQPKTHFFRPSLDKVLEKHHSFEDMPPVLAVVVESLPQEGHDLSESHHIVGHVSDLCHQSGRRTPGIIARRLTNLHLIKGRKNQLFMLSFSFFKRYGSLCLLAHLY